MIFFESPYMRVRLDGDVVVAEGEGYIDGDELRTGMNAGLKLLASKQLTKWLADMRFRRAMPEADIQWMAKDLMPRLVGAGMRWLAIVVPTSTLGMMSLRNIEQKIGERTYVTQYVDTPEAGMAWFAAQKK